MPVRIVPILIAASVLAGLPSLTSKAHARCDTRDPSCRAFQAQRAQGRDGSKFLRDRVRQLQLERSRRNQRANSDYGLPSSADLRPCQTRPIVSGERTRAVPTC